MKNQGEYAAIQLTTQRVASAMKSLTKTLSKSFYNDTGASTEELVGLRACCDETNTSTKYGGIAQTELVASDGTYPWTGRRDGTTESISLNVLRTQCTEAKIRDGANGKPDIIFTTPTLFDVVNDILQVQQRFVEAKDVVDAGFRGILFEGKRIIEDDYCPSGYVFCVNSKYFGFHIYKGGLFERTKWKVIPDSPEDKTMKIFFDGQQVCSNRKGQNAHSSLS